MKDEFSLKKIIQNPASCICQADGIVDFCLLLFSFMCPQKFVLFFLLISWLGRVCKNFFIILKMWSPYPTVDFSLWISDFLIEYYDLCTKGWKLQTNEWIKLLRQNICIWRLIRNKCLWTNICIFRCNRVILRTWFSVHMNDDITVAIWVKCNRYLIVS